jgi:hypothetical protein
MKMPLTPEQEEIFFEHLPHRINLLIAFRERFSGQNLSKSLKPEEFRDLYRCAKDISMLMVRFFCAEVGLKIKKGADDISEGKLEGKNYIADRVSLTSIQNDPCFDGLRRILIAANRAVAHIDLKDINHDISDLELISAIHFVEEEIIKTKIYRSREDFNRAMNLPSNRM